MLIEYRPSHLNKGPLLARNNSILRGYIGRRKLVFETMIMIESLKTSIFELCPIVATNSSNEVIWSLILQPQNQISNQTKNFILCLKKVDPRIARKIVYDH